MTQCPYKSPSHRHWWLEGYYASIAYRHRVAPHHLAPAYQTVWLAGWDQASRGIFAHHARIRRRCLKSFHKTPSPYAPPPLRNAKP